MRPNTGPQSSKLETTRAGQQEWVTIARLVKPRGRRGELSAISSSDHPERFKQLREVTLFGVDGEAGTPRTYRIEEVWEHGPRLVFKFEGVDTISAAERLRGATVCVPLAERFELSPDEFYYSDLVGCEVFKTGSQRRLGRVAGFLEMGGNGLLQVTGEDGREILIPFREALVPEVDLRRRRILVDPPEGLLDLNQG